MHDIGAFAQFAFGLDPIVAKSVISAVGQNRINRTFADIEVFTGFFDFGGNSFRRHFAAANRADDAVAVAAGDHVNGCGSGKDQTLFDGFVAVAVADRHAAGG